MAKNEGKVRGAGRGETDRQTDRRQTDLSVLTDINWRRLPAPRAAPARE